jgi:hypothetical protein
MTIVCLISSPFPSGVGLTDSPAGLAAYIIEKFITWTHDDYTFLSRGPNGAVISDRVRLEDVLDDVTIYWVTQTITSSVRMYAETQNKTQTLLGLMR